MAETGTAKKLGYVVSSVLKSPLSLALWVAGGVIAFGAGGIIPWPLTVALTLAAQVVLVVRHLHDEEYLRRIFTEQRAKSETYTEEQLEELLQNMDFETRQRIRYIVQLQRELLREAQGDDARGYAREELGRIATQVAPLLQSAIHIAQRRQQLAKYLGRDDERALTNYCANLRQRIDAATDAVTKSQYEQALAGREAELQTYRLISQGITRIDSQLENVEATFASWKARVIRIKAVGVSSETEVSADIQGELDSLNEEIARLDRSVTEAISGEGTLPLRQNGA